MGSKTQKAASSRSHTTVAGSPEAGVDAHFEPVKVDRARRQTDWKNRVGESDWAGQLQQSNVAGQAVCVVVRVRYDP